ncbi:hypothetical protein G7046_g459 [Stylonectria norvegica]|nr:hypothetical protein G7046_g459 [Stylonectria norvegica]
MFAFSELANQSTSRTVLGVALCVGVFAFVIHATIYNPKIFSQLLHLVSQRKRNQTKPGVTGDYKSVFPPSQRALLPQSSSTRSNDAIVRTLSTSPNTVLRIDSDYRFADASKCVFSGFTVGEVRGLGNLPDYAKLSGVSLPAPLKNFEIEKALARPYRPLRWAYHQTMSFKKMEADYWIELESTYRERIAQRQALYAQHGKDVLQALPGSELACKELMEMVLQFLCARYPQHFEINDYVLVNHILGTKQRLSEIKPLRVLLDNVPEDFAITLRDQDTGRYCFRAGVVCSSVGWHLDQKIGLGLPEIHKTVPDYKEKMEFSMDRFFTKMPTSSPIQRGSWGLEIGQPLYLPSHHPDFSHRDSQNPSLRPEDLYLRVDWQTLRRLPLSGGIVFNFKALFTPITEVQDEPYIPSLILKILREGKENLMQYKGTWHVEHIVKPTMERYERQQVEQGLIEKDWKHQTLDEMPFFPGWEKKYKQNS